jgi:diguanylate cyclase (GGDEF)-like protein
MKMTSAANWGRKVSKASLLNPAPWLRNRGIRARVLILTLLPLLLVASGLSWYFIATAYSEMDRALEQRALERAGQFARACEFYLFSGNHAELGRLAKVSALESDILGVAVSDPRGREIIKLGVPSLLHGHGLGLAAVGVAANSEEAILVIAPISPQPLAIDDVAAPPAADALGYVALEVSRQTTRQRQQTMLLAGLSITGIGLLLASLLAWRLGRDIVRPIGVLTQAVETIAAGDLNARVQVETGGEFALLERGVNRMAAELKHSYDTLQEKIRSATAKLTWQANHDALTGLLNRNGFDAALQQAWDNTRQTGVLHCLLYLDLDQFKLVNDTSGHQAGDELLRQLAATMRRTLRGSDVVARLGGDEFGVLLHECDAPTGEQLGEKLRQMIGAYRFSWNGRVYQVGASIGLVELDPHWPDTAHLMSAADAACYAAKDAGRNNVRLYRRGDEEVERRRGEMEWVGRLTRAMQAGHFRLYYQPIVALADSALAPHYELLLRLHDEEFPVLPMAFIPAAERYQIMPMIDRWVIEHALMQCASGMRASVDQRVVIGINLSGASLSDVQFQLFIRAAMRENALIAPQFCFEITETAAISNLETVQGLIDDLKALGCRFALDDFGSGLSSFAYLHNLAVDYLKIDGAFVRDMARDPVDAAMVEAIAKVARIMKIRTVAEYVEDQDTIEALKALGVDYGQGHYFAAPRPLAELCAELAARA